KRARVGSGEASVEGPALSTLDPERLVRDAAALVQIPSQTGDELAALERVGELAAAYGLSTELHEYDLQAVRASPDYPGEVASRDRLFGLTATAAGKDSDAPRICVNGHVDVVAPGLRPWGHSPWGGIVSNGRLYGRGSVDMKGGL